jgi:flagellar FliL protein
VRAKRKNGTDTVDYGKIARDRAVPCGNSRPPNPAKSSAFAPDRKFPLTIARLTFPEWLRRLSGKPAPYPGAECMADKNKRAEAENDQETEENEQPAPAKSRFSLKLIIIAVGAVAVLGGGGAAAFFMFKSKPAPVVAAPAPKPPAFLDLPDTLVNLANTGSDRPQYLKVKIVLELPDQAMIQQVQPVMPRVMDSFQTYLRELRPSDLDGSAGLYRLKEELTRRVNYAISPNRVNAVLFKEIVVQ